MTDRSVSLCCGGVQVKKFVPVLLVIGAVAVVAALALWGVLVAKFGAKPPLPPGAKLVNVRVMVIEPRKGVVDNAELAAVLEAQRTVIVSAEVAGRVEEVQCAEGATCKAGDPLLRLNTDLLKADLDRAGAQHKLAAASYKRVKQLFDADVAREEQLDNAKAALDGAKAALDAANARWARAQIVAPVGGVLDDMLVEKGEYVRPGTPVARIVDSSAVKAVVMVPEKDISYMTVGRPATVSVRLGERERVFTGEVTYISQLADRRTRATRVEVTVKNPEGLLRAGLIATVRLQRRKLAEAIMIPLGAVIPTENGHAVYVAVESRALRLTALCAGMSAAEAESQVGAPLRKVLGAVTGVEKVEFSTREVKLKVDPRLEPAAPLPADDRARIIAALEAHPGARIKLEPPIKSVVVCNLKIRFADGADMAAAHKAISAGLKPLRAALAASAVLGEIEFGTVAVRRSVEIDTSLIQSRTGAENSEGEQLTEGVEQYVRIKSGLKPGDRLIVAGHRFVGPGQPVRIEQPRARARSVKASREGTPAK
jgi:RND family efflux transporter MFP subunit